MLTVSADLRFNLITKFVLKMKIIYTHKITKITNNTYQIKVYYLIKKELSTSNKYTHSLVVNRL